MPEEEVSQFNVGQNYCQSISTYAVLESQFLGLKVQIRITKQSLGLKAERLVSTLNTFAFKVFPGTELGYSSFLKLMF